MPAALEIWKTCFFFFFCGIILTNSGENWFAWITALRKDYSYYCIEVYISVSNDGLHWSSSDSKSFQPSRIHLSIQTNPNRSGSGQSQYSFIYSLFHSLQAFPLSLSDSKSIQNSRTLLSILANPINAVICIFLILPLISKPLRTIPSAPTTIDIPITFMFHSFFHLSGKILVFAYLFIFLHFHSAVC